MADKQSYYIPIDGTLVEVEESVYRAYYKMKRRERYLEERDRDNGVLSYNALDDGGILGEAAFEDPAVGSMEDLALAKELIGQLHRCIAMLSKAERELIKAIYFDGSTEKEYASQTRMSQSAVSRKRKKFCRRSGNCQPRDLSKGSGRAGQKECRAQPIPEERPHRQILLRQQIRPVGAVGVRRVRHAVPKVQLERGGKAAHCLAVRQPPGLRKEILSQFSNDVRRTVAAGDPGGNQLGYAAKR